MIKTTAAPFPDVHYTYAFDYLEPKDLAACEAVSRQWRKVASHSQLWGSIARRIIKTPLSQGLNYKLLLQAESQTLHTNIEIIDRVQAFVNKMALGQNGQFICTVQIGGREQNLHLEITHKKPHENSVVHFDFSKRYLIHGIDVSAFHTEEPRQYESRSVYTEKLYDHSETVLTSSIKNSPIHAVLKIPRLLSAYSGPNGIETSLVSPIGMEYRITDIMNQRIEELSDELNKKSMIKKTTAVGLCLLGGYCIYAVLL